MKAVRKDRFLVDWQFDRFRERSPGLKLLLDLQRGNRPDREYLKNVEGVEDSMVRDLLFATDQGRADIEAIVETLKNISIEPEYFLALGSQLNAVHEVIEVIRGVAFEAIHRSELVETDENTDHTSRGRRQ